MLSEERSSEYLAILKSELVPALGCTEPIAVALAAAKARATLGRKPDRVEVDCSGNIVKNVKGVVVPNTGGLKGIEAAAAAGAIGGDADRGLEVLEALREEDLAEVRSFLDAGLCKVGLATDVDSLYVDARLYAGDSSAEVIIAKTHANIVAVYKDGALVSGTAYSSAADGEGDSPLEKNSLNVRDIIDFADGVALDSVRPIIAEQIRLNTAIADEGLKNPYGVDVGKTLLRLRGDTPRGRAEARAAAGSDARMSGCSLPVVINSGSGNQGMTASLPVIEYAASYGMPEERLYRALVLSNLVAIHQKKKIGRLSAYCGAVSAAAGAGAGICYLRGGGYDEISATIVNTIATIGGMVCDGAKPSCAAKIAQAVDAAFLALDLSASGRVFGAGEGLVKGDVEATINSVGRMGKVGMKGTDEEILAIMIGGEKD